MTFPGTMRSVAVGLLAWAIAAPGMGAGTAQSRADLPDPLRSRG